MESPEAYWAFETKPGRAHVENEATDDITGTRYLHQPWRAYWPPASGSHHNRWLQSEYPDVLSWRFDPARPFDRPWLSWRKQAQALNEQNSEAAIGQPMIKTDPLLRKAPDLLETAARAEERRELDKQLEGRKLPAINPVLVHYLAPLELYRTEKLYRYQMPCTDGFKTTNLVTRLQSVTVFDVSGNEDIFTLAQSGFEFAKCPIPMEAWTESSVCANYIPRLVEWLGQHLHSSRVYAYCYRLRTHSHDDAEKATWDGPFLRVHCDSTERSCQAKVRLYLPDECETLMNARIRFLNIWRPITTPVQDCPLALCDFRTVNREDLIRMDIVYPHFPDEAYEVLYSPTHRWFYKKGMQWDDVIIFKLGDNSDIDATVCPHTAFEDPSLESGAPKRASIEVKVIVIG